MANYTDDRWLWLGLGVFLFATTKCIAYGLRDIRTLTAIHDPELGGTKQDTQAEEAITSETLATLVQSPNQDISQAATSLLLERFLTSPANVRQWTDDFFSASSAVRKRAARLQLLANNYNFRPSSEVQTLEQMRGLLSRSINNNTRAAQTLRVAYHAARGRLDEGHPEAWNALKQVSRVLEQNLSSFPIIITPSLNGRQVLHWARAQKRLLELSDTKGDLVYDEAIKAMLMARGNGSASPLKEGSARSSRYGSVAERLDTDDDCESIRESDSDVSETDARDIIQALEERFGRFIDSVNGGQVQTERLGARHHEESPEEAEIRRRRREVMVLHEGEGTIGFDDIFQPRTA